MKIHGTAKGGALSKNDFGVAFGSPIPSITQSQLETGGSAGSAHFYESGASYTGMKFNSGTALGVGENIIQFKMNFKRTGSASGNVTAKLFDSDGTTVRETSSTSLSASTVSTSYTWYTFDFSNSVEIENGDIIACVYSAGSGAAYMTAQWHGTDVYDGTNSIFTNEADGDDTGGDLTFYLTYSDSS